MNTWLLQCQEYIGTYSKGWKKWWELAHWERVRDWVKKKSPRPEGGGSTGGLQEVYELPKIKTTIHASGLFPPPPGRWPLAFMKSSNTLGSTGLQGDSFSFSEPLKTCCTKCISRAAGILAKRVAVGSCFAFSSHSVLEAGEALWYSHPLSSFHIKEAGVIHCCLLLWISSSPGTRPAASGFTTAAHPIVLYLQSHHSPSQVPVSKATSQYGQSSLSCFFLIPEPTPSSHPFCCTLWTAWAITGNIFCVTFIFL